MFHYSMCWGELSLDPEARTLSYLPTFPQHLEQCLAHSGCSTDVSQTHDFIWLFFPPPLKLTYPVFSWSSKLLNAQEIWKSKSVSYFLLPSSLLVLVFLPKSILSCSYHRHTPLCILGFLLESSPCVISSCRPRFHPAFLSWE